MAITDAHDNSDLPRPKSGTWASIELRVERLELRVGELETAVSSVSKDVSGLSIDNKLIQQEQKHQKELMQTKFASLENLVKALSDKMDTIINDVRNNYGDTRATLASNSDFEKEIAMLREKVEAQQKLFDQLSGMGIIYRYAAGAGVAALLMSGAALLHSLGVI